MRKFHLYTGTIDPKVVFADEVKIKAHGAFFWKVTDDQEYIEERTYSGAVLRSPVSGTITRVLVAYYKANQYHRIVEVERVQDAR